MLQTAPARLRDELADEREQRQRIVQSHDRLIAGSAGGAQLVDPVVEHRTKDGSGLDETTKVAVRRPHSHRHVEGAEQDAERMLEHSSGSSGFGTEVVLDLSPSAPVAKGPEKPTHDADTRREDARREEPRNVLERADGEQ